jgi:rhodanese-related sulfurtransferase
MLMDKGYRNAGALKGGYEAWLEAGYPIEKK